MHTMDCGSLVNVNLDTGVNTRARTKKAVTGQLSMDSASKWPLHTAEEDLRRTERSGTIMGCGAKMLHP